MKSGFLSISQIIAGIILMLLNIGIWINGLFIHRGDGMDLVLAVPLLVIGALLLLGWYRTARTPKPTTQQQWKFILRILSLNYLILYALYMIQDILYSDPLSYLSLPGIIFPVILGLFIAGLVLSLSYELYAGFLFIIWYCVVLWGSLCYFEISNSGPHAMFGLVILLQGIFYLYYHFTFRSK